MDPALLKEREIFKRRALQQPVIEKKRPKHSDVSKSKLSKRPRPTSAAPEFDYKTVASSSQNRFAILAKIVKHLKEKHQQGDSYPITVDEILEETFQCDVNPRDRHWLQTQALVNNPKVEIVDGDTFKFKPKYQIRDRKELLKFLNKQDLRGEGGIMEADVVESLANAHKAMKHLGDKLLFVTRPIDKKRVLFYNDKNYNFSVDEDIRKLWRSVAVEGVDEGKIGEYLSIQGITSMQDVGVRPAVQKRKKLTKKRPAKFKTHNEHISDVLVDYSSKN